MFSETSPSHEPLRIAVLASGRGSNLRAILDAISSGSLRSSQVVLVISSAAGAGCLDIARAGGVPALYLGRPPGTSDSDHAEAILAELDRHRANFIALAGCVSKIDASIVRRFRNRILNIHPAILPDFGGKGMYGMRVHEAVLASGAAVSGASVHIVDEEYDRGPVVLRKTVEVKAGDTPASLAERVLAAEHELYPEALRLFAEDRIRVEAGRVAILDHA